MKICDECGDITGGSLTTTEKVPRILCDECWYKLTVICELCRERVMRTDVDTDGVCIWCRENSKGENHAN